MPPGVAPGRRSDAPSVVDTFANLRRDFDLRNDYAAAKPSKFRRTRTGLGGSGDAHYANPTDYFKVMEYVRDMDRSDLLIGWMLDKATNNAIQTGFQVQPDTGDEQLNADLKAEWDDWCSEPTECDAQGERSFWELEETAYRAALCDGDIFALLPDDGTVELIEAHRAKTPVNTTLPVIHGVLLDKRRRRQQYWFTRESNVPLQLRVEKVGDVQKYDAFDEDGFRRVLHVVNPKRVTQTRGMSALTPVFDIAGMIDDVNFAKLIQQQTVSCFAAFLGWEVGASPSDLPLGEREGDGHGYTLIERITPGSIPRLKPGQKLFPFAPNVPNEGYTPHVRMLLMFLGLALGLPLVELLMDAGETNFSGIRGAQSMARMGYRRNQKWLREKFHTHIYALRVYRRLIAGELGESVRKLANRNDPTTGRLYRHKWGCPSWESIQPVDDATAATIRMATLQSSPRREAARNSVEHKDLVRETVSDNGFAIEAAIKEADRLSKLPGGDGITWRDVLNRDLPRGMTTMSQTNDSLDVKNNSQAGTSGGGGGGGKGA